MGEIQTLAERVAVLERDKRYLEKQALRVAISLVRAAGGVLKVSEFLMQDVDDYELLTEKEFDTMKVVYVAKKKRAVAPMRYQEVDS